MTDRTPKMFDVVRLLRDMPEEGLRRGQCGAVVEELFRGAVLVEFVDEDGETLAWPWIPVEDVEVLIAWNSGKMAAE